MNTPAPARLDAIEMLTTTRSVRLRLDFTRSVPRPVIERCLEIATQAPSGSNRQGWRFLVVDDPRQRLVLADIYRQAHSDYEPPRNVPPEQARRLVASVDHLANHLHEVPALILPLHHGRLADGAANHLAASFYGSIFPAVWSFMLAARVHGLGTTFTTMHLKYEREVAAAFGIPFDRETQVGLIATAYYTGDSFAAVSRRPVGEVIHWNTW